jgi:hypothetical protein
MKRILLAMFCVVLGLPLLAAAADKPIKVLIIGGQNNHNWSLSTPYLKQILQRAGGFTVTVQNTPPGRAEHKAWDAWRPKFHDFDCVVLDYNGQMWPGPVQHEFVDYVKQGGSVMLIHAANNAFTGWKEFEKMAGLLWRPREYGYSLYLDDAGKLVREAPGQGRGMGHGAQYELLMTTRDHDHPVTRNMPARWLHTTDELYHGQRGPAENVHILLTAYSDPHRGGTGKNEPMVWWIPYGKGKVLTNVLGHVGTLGSMQCVGFQTLVVRGCRWLATGDCPATLPANFPTAEKSSKAP